VHSFDFDLKNANSNVPTVSYYDNVRLKICNFTILSFPPMTPVGIYDPDQSGSGLLDILRGGTERFLTNIKDTSSKVIQSVSR